MNIPQLQASRSHLLYFCLFFFLKQNFASGVDRKFLMLCYSGRKTVACLVAKLSHVSFLISAFSSPKFINSMSTRVKLVVH